MEVSSDKVLEELFKFQLTKLKLDLEQTTATVSQTVRTAAFGLAALVLPLITVGPDNVSVVIKYHPYFVETAAALGVFALMLEVCQNLFSAVIARQELNRIEAKLKLSNLQLTSPADFMFRPANKTALLARDGLYYFKIATTAIGLSIVVALILIDAPTNISPAPSASVVQPGRVPRP